MENIKLTKELVSARFAEYNRLYFDGMLGECGFRFHDKSSPAYGIYRYRVDRRGKSRSTISLGRCIDWNEERLRDTLVHEMIHMYVKTVEGRMRDGLWGHGRRFRYHMRRLNKAYGLNIKVDPRYKRKNGYPEPALWDVALRWLIDR